MRDPHSVPDARRPTLRACSARPNPTRRAAVRRGRQLGLVRAPAASPRGRSCCSSQPDDVERRPAPGARRRRADGRAVPASRRRAGRPDRPPRATRSAPRSAGRGADAGAVVVVNAPGNGVADDKAMYCLVPDLIEYYLRERPLLPTVPDLPLRRSRSECRTVLDAPRRARDQAGRRLRRAAASSSARRPRADELERAGGTRSRPTRPAGSRRRSVALSTQPTLADGRLEPRHVDLRAFVYLTGIEPGRRAPRRPGADPGGAAGQHGGQLVARRRGEGHLDRR